MERFGGLFGFYCFWCLSFYFGIFFCSWGWVGGIWVCYGGCCIYFGNFCVIYFVVCCRCIVSYWVYLVSNIGCSYVLCIGYFSNCVIGMWRVCLRVWSGEGRMGVELSCDGGWVGLVLWGVVGVDLCIGGGVYFC